MCQDEQLYTGHWVHAPPSIYSPAGLASYSISSPWLNSPAIVLASSSSLTLHASEHLSASYMFVIIPQKNP
ncbi:hypothetical protein BDA96_07G202700 [Sorghum bicolor]|uniref:Uncharacterized protein n=2 Tax=Sorghum bicolor TaxID=4558 RepID=A0A921QME8_SORBI|nr:hypothetical protein BDA96_07G202700 [Sorghum bicolor]KXG25514.1 hypothetical protein SORBI_3007G190600 [Sorghum bicolor]